MTQLWKQHKITNDAKRIASKNINVLNMTAILKGKSSILIPLNEYKMEDICEELTAESRIIEQ
jgi:hypothetical protein